MQMNRTNGQDRLERPTSHASRSRQAEVHVRVEMQESHTTAVMQAATTPAHGCWEEISAEEYERWDGLS